MLIAPTRSGSSISAKISTFTGAAVAAVENKRFPDGEMYIRILDSMEGEDVVVVGSTRSDSDILELMLLMNAAREGGARRVFIVNPYFGYARQHMVYKRGEPVSSKVLMQCLEMFSDRGMCVEMHDLETLKYSRKSFVNLDVTKTVAEYYSRSTVDLVISPDDGGYQRAREIGRIIGVQSAFIEKKRLDAKTVEMKLPDLDFRGRSILLVDDIISTGGTIIKATKLLKDGGARQIFVTAIHGIFANDSDRKIMEVASDIAVTDTIEGTYSKISVSRQISEELNRWIR
ncbi:MAG TPA: ribose-phosphate diphosphokinase [Thermoplasmataceae archaeon]|nr:ribose-phosphate diphosphokinase [Thermoplasmatales archaeon AK]HLH86118.1 ribose-phosphate diphosphokinase [Thermoplasmataceae archaeon]